MARGYPDYFGTSIWPKYGTPVITTADDVIVHGGSTDTMLTISCSGILFLAHFYIYCDDLANSHYLYFYVDGVLVSSKKLDNLTIDSGLNGSADLLNAVYFDNMAHAWVFELAREIPFHDSIVFKVKNAGVPADHVTVGYKTMHYVVT